MTYVIGFVVVTALAFLAAKIIKDRQKAKKSPKGSGPGVGVPKADPKPQQK